MLHAVFSRIAQNVTCHVVYSDRSNACFLCTFETVLLSLNKVSRLIRSNGSKLCNERIISCSAFQNDRRVLDHDFPNRPPATLYLYFLVRFYVESITHLQHATTVELFYLQVRTNFGTMLTEVINVLSPLLPRH